MLVRCPSCQSVIGNTCDECPWCGETRERIETPTRKYQISLLWLLLLVTAAAVWCGVVMYTQ